MGAVVDIGVCRCVGENALCGCMCQYGVCSIPPLAISPPSESSHGGNEDTCYKGCMVSSLFYVTFAFFEDVSVKGLPFSAEPRPPASHLESTLYAEIAQQHIRDLKI